MYARIQTLWPSLILPHLVGGSLLTILFWKVISTGSERLSLVGGDTIAFITLVPISKFPEFFRISRYALKMMPIKYDLPGKYQEYCEADNINWTGCTITPVRHMIYTALSNLILIQRQSLGCSSSHLPLFYFLLKEIWNSLILLYLSLLHQKLKKNCFTVLR